jgi:hypothetical protein
MTVINFYMTVVQNKKDNQRETIIKEIAVWALFFGVAYLLSRGIS